MAEGEIDKRTMGRLKKDPGLITESVKDCICEIAEFLFRANEFETQAREQGGAGFLTSYSNDGESGTFDLSQSVYTEEGKAGTYHRRKRTYSRSASEPVQTKRVSGNGFFG